MHNSSMHSVYFRISFKMRQTAGAKTQITGEGEYMLGKPIIEGEGKPGPLK